MLAALRPLHWAKNLLIFAPLLLAHRFHDPSLLLAAALAFMAFSLAASGTYLINDLRDAAHDRQHPAKRERLIASQKISAPGAVAIAALLLLAGFAIAFAVRPALAAWLAAY